MADDRSLRATLKDHEKDIRIFFPSAGRLVGSPASGQGSAQIRRLGRNATIAIGSVSDEGRAVKFLQVIAMLAGIASAAVALISYFGAPGSAKRGGAAPVSSAPATQPHTPSPAPSPPSGPGAGSHNPGSGPAGGSTGNQKK
jgi:hypothetical protein